MTTPTGIFFSYALGVIFTVGGILFLAFLDENRLLFGIPYLFIGLLLIVGVAMAQRRQKRVSALAAAEGEPEDDGPGSGAGT